MDAGVASRAAAAEVVVETVGWLVGACATTAVVAMEGAATVEV